MNLPQSKFKSCTVDSKHPAYQTFFCPACASTQSPEYKEFSYNLRILHARISEVFLAPNIGDWPITLIISHCMNLTETKQFLAPFTKDTVAYNITKHHVQQAIKSAMNAWIDSYPIQNPDSNSESESNPGESNG